MNAHRITKNYRESTMNSLQTISTWKREIETIDEDQEEMKITISELKNTVEGTKRRLDEAEGRISELEYKGEKNTPKEQEKEKMLKKNEEGLREMQDNMKRNNIHIVGIPEGEEEEQGIENLFEKVMMENFSTLMKEKVTQIQETQRVSIKRNPNVLSSRHIIIKMAKFKDKERILNTARGKQEVIYKGALIRLAADFSMETLQTRREWQEIFQVMKIKGPQLKWKAK